MDFNYNEIQLVVVQSAHAVTGSSVTLIEIGIISLNVVLCINPKCDYFALGFYELRVETYFSFLAEIFVRLISHLF